jgi:hypothetical protein
MVSDGFPDEISCSTTTITSLGVFDVNANDGEIRMMVVEELVVTNSTGDIVAASENCVYLVVVFPPIQQGSNHNYDSDAADSGYEPWSEEDSGDEGDSTCDSDASETGAIKPEDLICEENGRTYHTYGILPLWVFSIKLMFR